MQFYSFDEIIEAADCREVARELFAAKIGRDGRCACAWRGGDNPLSGCVERTRWYDHARKVGGTVIQLAAHHFGGDIQQAQNWLGERYGLTPKHSVRKASNKSRYDVLIEDGYKETARYEYRDSNGKLVHFVARLHHDTKPKQFVQGTPRGWGLRDTEPILYNLAAINDASWCCIVEGEKDADRLISLGIPATTCSGGSKKWRQSYSDLMNGKRVAILPDNDEPGSDHARQIAASLIGIAEEVKIVPTSQAPKGDVSNYLDEGHTKQDLIALIAASSGIASAPAQTAAPSMTMARVGSDDGQAVTVAKQANAVPFRNFVPVEVQNEDPRKKHRTEIHKQPRIIDDMVDDIHTRFLGFPRRVGSTLFDHDRDTGEIYEMQRVSDLYAWIGRKSHNPVEWARGDALVCREDLYSAMMAEARRYEAISSVPDWPPRPDTYYLHKRLPDPSEDHEVFRGLIRFFNCSSEGDERMLMAFFAAPLWFIPRVPRPSWIIGSDFGQGTGKTTIVEACAMLYDSAPITTGQSELQYGDQELVKRLLSSNGRKSRIVLIDNVTGVFKSPILSALITAWNVSGKRPYGAGEETRPNNLTYVITSNEATVDSDIATRSFYINIDRPKYDPHWKTKLLAYVDNNRYQIIADIIDMLERHKSFDGVPTHTRFGEFEARILQPMCEHKDIFEDTLEALSSHRVESNIEEDQARCITEFFEAELVAMGVGHSESVWLRSQVVNSWGRLALMDGHDYKGQPIQLVRTLAKQRLMPLADPSTKRIVVSGERSSGVLWRPEHGEPKYIISKQSGRNAEKALAQL